MVLKVLSEHTPNRSPDMSSNTHKRHQAENEWWRGAVIYQIYPRSFYDTSGNGVGDLQGIVKKLPYIAGLGVDAIWVSPFFKSPMKDFGYDVSDFRAVDPLFGSLDDFKALLEKAHALGLKVIIDQVLSHTSDQHEWFLESRQNRTNPKSDWYVWADPLPDGSPPNNWVSIFGGSAWEWDEQREQFYLHNFLSSQPDLNYHCAELRNQVLDEVEFWLMLGVDGFRFDAINFCYHDAQLRDNPEKPAEERKGRGFSPDNPYAAQYHLYDSTQPENIQFLKELRTLLDRYPGKTALGEVNSDDSRATMAEYTQGDDKLHMAYSFELLADEFGSEYLRNTVASIDQALESGWPCWALNNHDVERVVSRWGKNRNKAQFAKMALALSTTLRGTICLYQGEELGLPEAPISRSQLRDPFGIQFWPEFKGRDGCRTPIPWDSAAIHSGFSPVEPWLPIPDTHRNLSVLDQCSDESSVLNFYRRFLAWRKSHECFIQGDMEFIDSQDGLLVYKRTHEKTVLYACFNLSNEPKNWSVKGDVAGMYIHIFPGLEQPEKTENGWQFQASQFGFFEYI